MIGDNEAIGLIVAGAVGLVIAFTLKDNSWPFGSLISVWLASIVWE